MAQYRKESLINNQYYHIYSRSISRYTILNDASDYERFNLLISLYRHSNFHYSLSQFIRHEDTYRYKITDKIEAQENYIVEIVAYCFMPTHIHLILKQVRDGGITKFMARVLNGYSRYFNTKHKRIGPLWSGRFKSVRITDDEQHLHLTRYLHLNPTSAGLVDMPGDWPNSSYEEFIDTDVNHRLCKYNHVIRISMSEYRKFTEDHKSYQRDLSIIKNLTIDNYSG